MLVGPPAADKPPRAVGYKDKHQGWEVHACGAQAVLGRGAYEPHAGGCVRCSWCFHGAIVARARAPPAGRAREWVGSKSRPPFTRRALTGVAETCGISCLPPCADNTVSPGPLEGAAEGYQKTAGVDEPGGYRAKTIRTVFPSPLVSSSPRPAKNLAPPPRSAPSPLHSQRPGSVLAQSDSEPTVAS